MRRAAWLAAFAACSALAACADLFGFHDLREADAGDAATDVTVCTPATWPANPAVENKGDGGSDAGPFTIALRHVYFATAPDGGATTYGYDLDGKCTVDQASASCTSSGATVDQANGVDDQSITLMNTLVGAYPAITGKLSDDNLNAAIATGYFTVLFRLLNYNGGSDQPINKGLQVAVQASPGISGDAGPGFDGGDIWNVSLDDSLTGSSTYPKNLFNAYVAGGVLVANFPGTITLHVDLPPGIITGPLSIILEQPTLTAKLVPRGGGYDMTSGLIVGRWASRDILANVASLTLSGESLCDYSDASVWPLVVSKICGDDDIRANGPDDDTKPCDAVSVAIAFDAVAADVTGTPVSFPTTATPCSHDAGDCSP